MSPQDARYATVPDWSSLLYVNLRRGRDGARSLSELAEAMDCPRRVLEKAVRSLRLNGFPVASDGTGHWIADDWRELQATFTGLRHRVKQQSITSYAVRRTMRAMRDVQEGSGGTEQLVMRLDDAA